MKAEGCGLKMRGKKKSFLGRQNTMCTGSEEKMYLVHSRKRKKE